MFEIKTGVSEQNAKFRQCFDCGFLLATYKVLGKVVEIQCTSFMIYKRMLGSAHSY